MQFGFFLLLLAAAVLTSCEVASASADVTATLSKTTTSPLIADEPDAANKGSRYLRTGVTEDAKRSKQLDEEERLIVWLQSFLAKFGASPKMASPPKADVLSRSKSFSGNDGAGAVQKLTRSKSLSSLKSKLNLEQAAEEIERAATPNLLKDFKTFEKQGQNPDNMFKSFNLDRRLVETTEPTQVLAAVEWSGDVYGHYLLWYQYLSFYKKEHPAWVSTLVKPKLD